MWCSCCCRFATAYEGKYSDSINQAYVYPSSNYLDDIAWAAVWLYERTGEQQFLTVSVNHDPPHVQGFGSQTLKGDAACCLPL